MSTCLGGGGGCTYGFDLDLVKTTSSSSSIRSSQSSTLSDSSNLPLTISIKRTRTPRKRPNQTYNEAAALLSAIHPSIFSSKSPKQLSTNTRAFYPFPESSDLLLPSLPVLSDAAFLIRRPQPEKPPVAAKSLQLEHQIAAEKDCTSPVSNLSWEATSPDLPFNDEFDVESILDEEVEQGIDSIIGNLQTDTLTTSDNNSKDGLSTCNSSINPLHTGLIGQGMGGRFELGFGLRFGRALQWALRKRDEGDWWRSPAVPVRDITPNYKSSTAVLPLEKKSKNQQKKVDTNEVKDIRNNTNSILNNSSTSELKLKATSLGLKLDHEDVLKAWSDRGSMFSDELDYPNLSAADDLSRLVDIDLSPESAIANDVREASVVRYKEKRRTRFLSEKIRYQIRKVNADQRPRMKGRFARKTSLLQQAIEEENQ
ncbi:protein CHLOROPLAST IMPORT APPARATUS 2-like isoform X2 [Canna indica]|uniref:Protein CHLOROPLAST IMPORT APPARATUS 2-like isoform X2 n=1 Tax=Canna indica TaxID=4628 RepID=A0AAQ3Q5W7_9LILI|nr:protein CHLOROPLAST IMPORT APPARATUS 2-like isoform X2 [Canna indica]